MSIVILVGHVSINVTYGQLQSLLKSDCVVKQRRTKSWLLLSTWSMKELSFTPRDGVCFDLHEKTYLNKNKSLFVIKDIPYYRWKWSKLGLFSDQTAKNPCYLSVTPPHPTPIGWHHEKALSILLTVLSPVPHDWIPLNFQFLLQGETVYVFNMKGGF